MPGADLPEMQIGQPVATGLDALADTLRQRRIGHGVEEDAAGRPDQSDRPGQDDDHADETDQWVHDIQAERPSDRQTEDRQHRGESIGHHVQIRRPVVRILPAVVTVCIIGVCVMMVRVSPW
jgi:hypothetical protein